MDKYGMDVALKIESSLRHFVSSILGHRKLLYRQSFLKTVVKILTFSDNVIVVEGMAAVQ